MESFQNLGKDREKAQGTDQPRSHEKSSGNEVGDWYYTMLNTYRPRPLSKVGVFDWEKPRSKAELFTNDVSILFWPVFITNCSPLAIVIHFNTSATNVIIRSDDTNSVSWKINCLIKNWLIG